MKNSFRISIILFILFSFSLISIPGLNISAYPIKTTHSFSVIFSCSHSSPEQTEQKATALLENLFSQVKNLKDISSTSAGGFGKVELTFDNSENILAKKLEMMSLLRQVRAKLPIGVSYPKIISSLNSSKQSRPNLIYSISSSISSDKIKAFISEKVVPRLSLVNGIADTQIDGYSGNELQISYDKNILLSLGLVKQDIVNSLEKSQIASYTQSFNLRKVFTSSKNGIASIQELKELPIKNHVNVNIGAIADINIQKIEPSQYLRINGKNLILLNIYFQDNSNSIAISSGVKQTMDEISSEAERDIGISIRYDESKFLMQELNSDLKIQLISFFSILVLFILYFRRNWNHYFSFLMRMFLTVFLSILLIRILNINLNIYSIQVLSLILPCIVCYCLITLEYTATKATGAIEIAILMSSIIAITSFNIYFFNRENPEFAFELFKILSVCSISGLITTTCLYYSERSLTKKFDQENIFFLTTEKSKIFSSYMKLIGFFSVRKKILILLAIFSFGVPTFLLPTKIDEFKIYNSTIGSSFYQNNISQTVNKAFGGISRLFMSTYIKSKGDLNSNGETILNIQAKLSSGSDIESINSVILNLERYISKFKGINSYYSHVKSDGSATMEISFQKKYENTNLPNKLKNLITSKILEYGGTEWNVFGVGRGFSNMVSQDSPSFSIKMTGYDYQKLVKQSINFCDKLALNKRVVQIASDQTFSQTKKTNQLRTVVFDENRLVSKGINKFEIYKTLNDLSNNGDVSANLVLNNEMLPVRIRENCAADYSLWELQNSPSFHSRKGNFKISSLGKIEETKSVGMIQKINREYVKVITLNYLGDYIMGINFLSAQINDYNKTSPIGFSASIRGYEKSDNVLLRYFDLFLLLLTVLSCCIICAIYLEDFSKSMELLFIILIIYTGQLYAFYLFDEVDFDQGGIFSLALNSVIVTIFFNFSVNKLERNNNANLTNQHIICSFLRSYKAIFFVFVGLIICNLGFVLDIEHYHFFWPSFFVGTVGGAIMAFFGFVFILPVFLFSKSKIKG